MLIARLIDSIRFEAGLQGTSKAAPFIRDVIVEILRELTGLGLYQELLTLTGSVTIAAPATTFALLPSDYQHLKVDSVRYLPAGSEDDSYFLLESEYTDFTNSGPASRFQIAAKKINLYPNSETAIGDIVKFEYYKYITALLDTDEFPVPELEATVKKKSIARLKSWMGQNPQSMESNSELSLARSKGNGTDD